MDGLVKWTRDRERRRKKRALWKRRGRATDLLHQKTKGPIERSRDTVRKKKGRGWKGQARPRKSTTNRRKENQNIDDEREHNTGVDSFLVVVRIIVVSSLCLVSSTNRPKVRKKEREREAGKGKAFSQKQ